MVESLAFSPNSNRRRQPGDMEEKVRTAVGKLERFGPMTIATGEQLLSQPGLEEQLTTGGNPGRRRIAALLTNGATGCAARCKCGSWQVAIWDPEASYLQMWDRTFGGGIKKHVKRYCALVGQEDSVPAERSVGGAEVPSPAPQRAAGSGGVTAAAGEQQGAAKQAASVRQKPVKRPSAAAQDGGACVPTVCMCSVHVHVHVHGHMRMRRW